MTTVTYDWLMSRYDGTWHAFPAAQATDPNRAFLNAACDHCVPTGLTDPTTPTGVHAMCPACVVIAADHRFGDARWPCAARDSSNTQGW